MDSRILRRRRVAIALAVAILLAAPYLWFRALDFAFPFPWENLQRPAAVVVTDRHGQPLRFFLPADEQWRFPMRLSEMPPELPKALVASEDRRFYRHFGVDPAAVMRAAWSNLKSGEVVSGASTIPMQVARMAEPGPRTLASKARESFRALQLERRFTKDQILELYLNLTPYGGNVEGVGAAAWFYFGKEPDQLSLGEIALLTALPRAPAGYDPTVHPQAASAARDRVLAQLAARGVFPRREIVEARFQPMPRARRRPPFMAPHFTAMVTAELPGEARIRTTLDRRTQDIAEAQVARRIRELRDLGIGNTAVVVIDNETRAVRAMVGSAGFRETVFQGQINGAAARRSPGSTLKPFLYAMAIDQGRVLPESYLLDIPTDFSGYVAENYDERYRGRVTVREALIQSLNACAVRLLAQVGLADFQKLLLRGGLSTLDRPAGSYGLPLVLGAGEVRLLDLANLYASLAEGGVYRPVRMVETEPPPPSPLPLSPRARGKNSSRTRDPEPLRLFSPDAARAIAEILTDVRRPDLPAAWELTRDVPAVAWKTGTSYGHRDAWAVGFSARTTIGVWVGNFDGKPRKGISGSQHAGPLLFDLFRALEPGGRGPVKKDGLVRDEIEVCALSHELPGPFCPERVRIPYLPERTKLAACSLHRRMLVDGETGELLAGDCMNRRPHEFRLLTIYPPELVAWWRSQGAPVQEVPRLASTCEGIPSGEPPRIVSPDGATPYRLRRDAPAEYQRIPLVAQVSPGVRHLYWYQDGTLVATTETEAAANRFLSAIRGEHRLVVTDDLGRSDGVTYKVE
ncbi:MAG TPA: penicillin-binding protein 1C [Thermoanaerobaculia bacterium]|jgi:penicillin-binding protein 1C|nr:penicillin-binding protein 1C [Thermoanaerobaculia bacterium]